MNEFNGFPVNMRFTPVPNLFFSTLLKEIDDIAELKTVLYLFNILYEKKGAPRFVTYFELLSNPGLIVSLRGEKLDKALQSAVKHNIILSLPLEKDGKKEDIYFLNTQANKDIFAKIQSGEIVLSGLKTGAQPPEAGEEQPDVFTLYERNIGLLTPIIAEQLRDALKNYPEDWIKDAIKEAVSLNKRNWRYISRILERWSSEGRDDGTHRGHLKTSTDPDKYIKGKYGHMVRR